ncbi:MAG: M14-type cytosolic carboxypeptidase [Candidatus Pacearchaeota archaeon]
MSEKGERERKSNVVSANRKIALVFFILLVAIVSIFYSNLVRMTGRTTFNIQSSSGTRTGTTFDIEMYEGGCWPENSIITVSYAGVTKSTTLKNFVSLGGIKLNRYYARFTVKDRPDITGIGFCYGIPGQRYISSLQQIYGFGESFIGKKVYVPIDISVFKFDIQQGSLEFDVSYFGKSFYHDVFVRGEIPEVPAPSPTTVTGKLLETPLGTGEGVIITSNFEQGNLKNVSYAGNGIYKAQINMSNFSLDPSTPAKYQWWFYFKADNCSGKNFVVNITNLLDADVNENRWRNIWPVYSFDNNETWLRLNPLELSNNNYFKLYEVSGNNSFFIINITPSTCPVWIAALHPYSLSKSWNFINSITKYHSFVNVTTIGYSEGNREVKMITITDFNYNDTGKRKILVFAGQHGSTEPQGVYALEGMLSFLTGNDPLVSEMRRNAVFKIVNIINVDNNFLGIPRFNVRDEDLNREWGTPTEPGPNSSYMAREVWFVRNQRISFLPDVLLDLHGSVNDDTNYFLYPENNNNTYQTRLNNLMNNISTYWQETGQRGTTSLSGFTATQRAYLENGTLALLIEFAQNCIDGGSNHEQANITTCFNKYILSQNDWRQDGSEILRGVYSYICLESGACNALNLPPVITVRVPENTTYSTKDLTFEITTNEIASLCWYNLDSSDNITMHPDIFNPYRWLKDVSLSLGQHNVIFYCNDSEGAVGSSPRIYFTITSSNQITNCTVISQPGYYTLMNDIINSQNTTCINISANNVTFDCQGHTIDGIDTSNTYGIYMNNRQNNTIKNCVVTDFYDGIYLYSSSNNSITNNTASSNIRYGIVIHGSHNNRLTGNIAFNNGGDIFSLPISGTSSQNNTFINQTIAGSGFVYPTKVSFTYAGDILIKGVTTQLSLPSGYNSINKFIEATNQSAGAWLFLNVSYNSSDLGSVNENTLRMWKYNDSWYGPDSWANPNNVNTAQDYVYANITSFSVFAPLGQAGGNQAPTVTLNLPQNNSVFVNVQNINFNFTATDDQSSILTCSIYLDNFLNQTNNSVRNNTLTNFLIQGISYGQHNWKVNCSDGTLSSVSEIRFFSITMQDNPPRYSLNSTNSTIAGQVIRHNLYWQDDVGLSYAIFSFDNCTNVMQNVSGMSLSGQGSWSNFSVVVNSTVGCTIRWCVYANDSAGNWNSTSCLVPFSYVTTEMPKITIQLLEPDNGKTIRTSLPANVTFKWKAIDLVNQTMNCSLYIDSNYVGSLDCQNNTNCNATVTGFEEYKEYSWQVNCSDWNGNRAVSDVWEFELKQRTEDGRGGGGGGGGGGECGNNYCNSNVGENQTTCCLDCGCPSGFQCINNSCQQISQPYCGDNFCNGNETQETCCRDCGCPQNSVCVNNACQAINVTCGNNVCDAGETLINCRQDCFDFYCGDNVCDSSVGENSSSCCKDCPCPEGYACKPEGCVEKGGFSLLLIIFIALIAAALIITVLILLKIKSTRAKARRYHLERLMPESRETSSSGFVMQ